MKNKNALLNIVSIAIGLSVGLLHCTNPETDNTGQNMDTAYVNNSKTTFQI